MFFIFSLWNTNLVVCFTQIIARRFNASNGVGARNVKIVYAVFIDKLDKLGTSQYAALIFGKNMIGYDLQFGNQLGAARIMLELKVE